MGKSIRTAVAYANCLIAFIVTGVGFGFFLYNVATGHTVTSGLVFVVSYTMMGLGITVGFHRYGVHRAFEFTALGKWIVRPILLIAGSAALQNTMWFWTTAHKKHHSFTDEDEDPHSPHHPGGTAWQRIGQFLWSHMLWIPHFHASDWKKFCQWEKFDWFEKLITWAYIPIILCPPALVWLCLGWEGLAAYLAAIFLLWHVTAAVNSITHSIGTRPFKTGDKSTNLWWLAWLSFGEFLHNNHHRWQKSARFAQRWYEYIVDVGWWPVWLMRAIGLARKVHTA